METEKWFRGQEREAGIQRLKRMFLPMQISELKLRTRKAGRGKLKERSTARLELWAQKHRSVP
jgi:hypothetical protein